MAPDPDDMIHLRRWDDDADEDDAFVAGAETALDRLSDEELFRPITPPRESYVGAATAASLNTCLAAGLAVGRLDARLRVAPEAVRQGWQARMLMVEAAASSRLDDHLVDPDDLLAWECGLDHDGPPSPALSAGIQTLEMLRVSVRRSPRSFWTPRRLMRLGGMISSRTRRDQSGMPDWLRTQRIDRDTALDALGRMLDPGRIEAWKALPPLLAASDIVRSWHDEGLAETAGGAVGRLLGVAWPWRMGELDGFILPISRGFLGHAADYAPWRPDWSERWLAGVDRGARWGSDLLADLVRTHRRLTDACEGRRKSSRLPLLVDLLVQRPAVSSGDAAGALGVTKQGVLNMLEDLASAGLIREISRRGSHWVWQASPA